MSDKHLWASAVLIMSLTVNPGTAAAEPLPMPSETANAMQAFAEATQQLAKAKAAMAAVEAGEKPLGAPQDWAGAISGYENAADAIRKSGGPAVPDASGYGVATEQLRSCATRSAAVARLDKHIKSLHALSQQASDTRALLKARLDAAHGADDTRRYLVKAAAKLAGSPALADAFTWSWQDLETSSGKAIATYAGELKRYQDRVEKGNAELKARAAALYAQLEAYAGAKDCLLAGNWAGSRSQGGAVAGLTLHLVVAGSSWNGTANVDGKTVAVRSVAISGSSVSVALAEGKGSMKGTLSADGRSYHGSFSSMDGPGSFNLFKQ